MPDNSDGNSIYRDAVFAVSIVGLCVAFGALIGAIFGWSGLAWVLIAGGFVTGVYGTLWYRDEKNKKKE